MQLDTNQHPCRRDGLPAILSGAWIDPAALASLPEAQRNAHLNRLQQARFDCLLWNGDAATAPDLHQAAQNLASAFSAKTGVSRPLIVCRAQTPTDAAGWPATLGAAEAPTPAQCSRCALIVAWARHIAAGADRWATALFARPFDSADPAPAETLVRTFHRLQTFARKQGELLLHSPLVTDANLGRVLEQPPRTEVTLRQLTDKPVWTVFVINASLYASRGPLRVGLGPDEVDLGMVRLQPERFAVFQITRDRRPATNRHRPVPELAREKGQAKSDHVRINALLRAGWRVRTLFHGTEV